MSSKAVSRLPFRVLSEAMLVAIGVDQLLLITKGILLPEVLTFMGKKSITVNLKASLLVFMAMHYQKCAVIYLYI